MFGFTMIGATSESCVLMESFRNAMAGHTLVHSRGKRIQVRPRSEPLTSILLDRSIAFSINQVEMLRLYSQRLTSSTKVQNNNSEAFILIWS